MRIAAKRLRYLLELSEPLFGPAGQEGRQAGQGPPGPARRDPRLRRAAAARGPACRGAANRGRGRCRRPRGAGRRGPGPRAGQGRAAPFALPRAGAPDGPHARAPRPPARPLRPGVAGRWKSAGSATSSNRRCSPSNRHRKASNVTDTTTEAHPATEDETAPQGAAELPPPSERFLNRELSWLDFNDRVVELADDEAGAAARAGQVPGDLPHEPGRVLHGPRGRAARPGRRRRRRGGRRRAEPVEPRSTPSTSACRNRPTAARRCGRSALRARAGRARHPHRAVRRSARRRSSRRSTASSRSRSSLR